MASVHKTKHRPRKDGSVPFSWRAVWTAPDGARQSKNFPRKSEATAWLAEVSAGRVGGSTAMTFAELAEAHIAYFDSLVRLGKRQAVTRDGYQTALDQHLKADPALARTRLAQLRTPTIQASLDDLVARTGSTNLARSIRRSYVTWCKFGMRRGWLLTNPAQACEVERDGVGREAEPAFEIPPKEVLAKLLRAAAEGPTPARDTMVVRLLMFAGLRASELLGLADDAITVRPGHGAGGGGKVKIRERLDRHYRTLDPPKSEKGRRDVPIGEGAALAVRAWRLARGPVAPFEHVDGRRQPRRVAGRLLPNPTPPIGSNTATGVWSYNEFHRHCWLPLMRRAGLVQMLPDSKGKNRPVLAFGPHTLRHVAASLWIDQGLRPKKVQELLGHATLQLTMDLYGHLWSDPEADDALAQASERLIGG